MATIEHMYEMLQKLKNDISYNELKNDIFDESLKKNDSTIFDNGFCSNELFVSQITELKDINKNISYETEILTRTIESLVNKVISLENEMKELKEKFQNTHQNNKINCVDNDSKEKEEHIKLKIEEKNIINDNDNLTKNYDTLIEEEEEDEEEQEQEEVEEVEETVDEEEEEEVEEVEETVVEEKEEEEAVVEEKEEEVVTDEEQEVICLEEKDNDEDEVFEIEIDDITYFTTDEENGILYEVDSDGEVGKKVGIIKNGEPIFS
jgi:hypothetical protein